MDDDSKLPNLGEQEMVVLRHIAAAGSATAKEIVEAVSAERGIARSTVLTVIDRLRIKGYVTRKLSGAVFVYGPRVPQAELMKDLVKSFVEKSLGGSVSPMVAYLSGVKDVTPDDLDEMQKMVDELKRQDAAKKAPGDGK